MVDKDKIDDIYRDGFDDFEIPVSDKLLSAIKQELIITKPKSKFKGWVISFAVVLVGATAAYFIYSNSSTNKNNELTIHTTDSSSQTGNTTNENVSNDLNAASENGTSASENKEGIQNATNENGENSVSLGNDENVSNEDSKVKTESKMLANKKYDQQKNGTKTNDNNDGIVKSDRNKNTSLVDKESKHIDKNNSVAKKSSKHSDKKIAESTKDSKHIDKNTPADKKSSKHIDKNTPDAGKESKHLDKNDPEVGKSSKHIDKNDPAAKKESKHIDKNAPEDGKESKHIDKNAPEAGKESKHIDKNDPATQKESKHIDKNTYEETKNSKSIDKNNLNAPEEKDNKSNNDNKTSETKSSSDVKDSLQNKKEEVKPEETKPVAEAAEQKDKTQNNLEDKKTKINFFVDVNAGPSFSYRKLTGSNPALQNRNDNEKNLTSYNVGVDFGAIVKDKFVVNIGVGIDNKGEKYSYAGQDLSFDTTRTPIVDSGNIIGWTIDTTNFQAAIDARTGVNKSQFLRIPIMVGYQFTIKEKWFIRPMLGININYLLSGTSSWVQQVNDSTSELINYTKADFNKMTISGRIKLDIGYNVTDKFSISIQPGYTRFLQTIYRKDSDFKLMPYSYDINLGLRYKF